MLKEFLAKLPDEQYKKCKITDKSVILPIDVNLIDLKKTLSSASVSTILTEDKAALVAIDYIISPHDRPYKPLDKLKHTYVIAKPRQ